MIRGFYACFTVLFLSSISYAQTDNSYFDWEPVFNGTDSGRFGIEVENLNYMRNLEYTTYAAKGRTLFGFQAGSQVHYQVSSHVAIRGGIYATRDFGKDQFNRVAPLFGITWKKNNSTLNFGNLQGAMMHRLIQPLYDPDRQITHRLENGLQYLLNRDRLFLDVWLNWEKYIEYGSPFQEEFTGGISSRVDLIKREGFRFAGVVQMLAKHKGGEINDFKAPANSRYNFNYGARLDIPVNRFLGIQNIGLQAHFTYFEDPSRHLADTFIDGLGQYLIMTLEWDRLTFMANYWDAHQFMSPNGDPIFRSISKKNPMLYSRDYRKLAAARVFYELPLSSETNLLFRGTVYRDITWETWDYVAELYIRWNIFRKLNQKNETTGS